MKTRWVEGYELTPEEIRHQIRRVMRRIRFREGNHWEWTGRKNDKGYGQIRLKNRVVKVHRLLYALFVGDLENNDGHHICHFRACANPAHIQPCPPVAHRFSLWRQHDGEAREAWQ